MMFNFIKKQKRVLSKLLVCYFVENILKYHKIFIKNYIYAEK